MKYVVGFLVACVMWVAVLYNLEVPEYKIYDCGMAEWHPDVPIEVKIECRKMRSQNRSIGV